MNLFRNPSISSARSVAVLLLVGALAGVTVGGGVGVIAASSTKSVTVCANKKTSVLRYAKNGKCIKSETRVVLNQTGATGATGASGATGAAGTKGDTGAAGTNGTNGDMGKAGTNGTNGANTNSQIKNICGQNGTIACAVGEKGPGGGIVFMTPTTPGNASGLFYEAAPSTWSSPSGDPISTWCSNDNTVLGVASTVTGTGAMDGANKTTVMMGVCTSGAANLVDAYVATVNDVAYADWFLPSKGELQQMYTHRSEIGGFSLGEYWSSSEFDKDFVWYQGFDNGNQGTNGKNGNCYGRPVRAF